MDLGLNTSIPLTSVYSSYKLLIPFPVAVPVSSSIKEAKTNLSVVRSHWDPTLYVLLCKTSFQYLLFFKHSSFCSVFLHVVLSLFTVFKLDDDREWQGDSIFQAHLVKRRPWDKVIGSPEFFPLLKVCAVGTLTSCLWSDGPIPSSHALTLESGKVLFKKFFYR